MVTEQITLFEIFLFGLGLFLFGYGACKGFYKKEIEFYNKKHKKK